jgi:hypothetical protein
MTGLYLSAFQPTGNKKGGFFPRLLFYSTIAFLGLSRGTETATVTGIHLNLDA